MGHKRKRPSPPPTSSEDSSLSSQSQICLSQSQSSSEDIYDKKLSKKDLKQLIKLEKAIQKEEKLLKKVNSQKKVKVASKKQGTKKQSKNKEDPVVSVNTSNEIPKGRKLFITAIDNKYTKEEVSDELNEVLKSLQGVIEFRIKQKQGCPTYAFVDFDNKINAKEGIQKFRLRNRKLFGQKMAIYYSQDREEKKEANKLKACFECNETGHFARQCPNIRSKVYFQNEQTSQNPVHFSSQEFEKQQQRNTVKQEVMQFNEEPKISRVVRDKSRLKKLLNGG